MNPALSHASAVFRTPGEITPFKIAAAIEAYHAEQLALSAAALSGEYQPIIVWEFHQAPPNLRDLSCNGGDEDYMAELPPCYDGQRNYDPMWLEKMSCCNTDYYDHPTKPGWRVAISCHS